MKKKLKISVSGEDNELTSIFFTPCSDENLPDLLITYSMAKNSVFMVLTQIAG